MTIESRSSNAGGLSRGDVNMALAMEAHGITFTHLVPPQGDRLPERGAWGKVLHRATRRRTIRAKFPVRSRLY